MTYGYVKPTIGGDPEFFFYDKQEDGTYKLIPADKLLPGKDNPQSFFGGDAFFDGVQAEINPKFNRCREVFVSRINSIFEDMYSKIKNKYGNIYFVPHPSIKVDLDEIKGCDKECFRFGCAPDDCIYEERNIKYPDGKKFKKRFAGGHIHIGFSNTNLMRVFRDPDNLENAIKMMDLIAGTLSVSIANNQREKDRRKWYGQAGTYRIQPHGIEYRTLSPFWLTSPSLASLFTGLIRDSVRIVYGGGDKDLLDSIDINEVRKVIDTFDVKKANEIVNDIVYPFYKSNIGNNAKTVPLASKKVRDFVDKMRVDGYDHYFSPYHMLYYWNVIKNPKVKIHHTWGGGILTLVNRLNRGNLTYEDFEVIKEL